MTRAGRQGIKHGENTQPKKENIKYMDVSENRGTPKWMVYNGKPY